MLPPPSADGYGRPPRPQVDRREVRPHLCTRRAGARVRTRGADRRDVVVGSRKVDVRLPGKGNSKLLWREAGPLNHLDDTMDSDQ